MAKKYLITILSLFLTLSNFYTSPIFAQEEEIVESEEAETVEIEEIEEADKEDDSFLEGIDFSSKRFIVRGDASIFTEEDHILGSFDQYFLVQYDSEQKAKDAYLRLYDQVESIDVDYTVYLEGCEDVSSIQMDERNNPFVKQEDVVAKIAILGKGEKEIEDTILNQNPLAEVVSLSVFDAQGRSSVSSLYAAISQAIRANVDVLYFPDRVSGNLSFVTSMIHQAAAQGILVVGSLGNIEDTCVIAACDEYGNLIEEGNQAINYKVVASSSQMASAIFVGEYSKKNQIVVDNTLVLDPDSYPEEEIEVYNETKGTVLFTKEEGKAIVDLAKQLYDAHATTYYFGGRSYTNTTKLDCAGFVNYILMKLIPSKAKTYSYSGSSLNDGRGGTSCGTRWWSGFLSAKGVAKQTVYTGDKNVDLSACSPGDLVILYDKNKGTHHIGIYAGQGMVYHCTIGPVDLGNYGPANDGIHYDPLVDMPDINCSPIAYYTIFHCAQEVPYEKLEGYSLTLDGTIGMNFYVQMNDAALVNPDSTYMEFHGPNGKEQIPLSQAETVEVNGKICRKFTYRVSAKNMTEKVTGQIHFGENLAGEEYSYSVEDCANYMISNALNYAPKDISIAKALLTYGRYTQEYFEYNLDNIASNTNALEDCDLSTYQYTLEDENEDLQFLGARLILTAKPAIRLSFRGAAEFNVDSEDVEIVKEGNSTTIWIRNINCFDQMFDIEAENFHMTYGIYSYGYRALEVGNESLQNLIKAMVAYQACRNAY
ncbi:MAG: C40 family peptidase [Firmicutes bacterium]|nr:C40 family peptidase [Bacillota bacterium]